MIGTIINTLAVIVGGVLGTYLIKGIPDRIKATVIQGIGLSVIYIGMKTTWETRNPVILIVSLALGGTAGELLHIEEGLEVMGNRLEKALAFGEGTFSKGFIMATLVYCVGAMAIMGSLQDGLTGRYDILLAKSALDGITAIIFSSTMGIGVAFSALPLLVYQGAISLLAQQIRPLLTEAVVAEMSAAGGLLILGIGINLLEVARIRVAALLPAIVAAAALAALLPK
ncbi:MAG: DUF554 domain-containing protein [Firmicutes bacterium]|nr:DUF554 domain-containing protein [Bacillota bacterium]MCL5040540.1 DUF554 domain-containing protein [Bacillota bacterium]